MARQFDIQSLLALITWVIYHILRLCIGLVLHPYRTAREIMRGRWFVPLILLPSGILTWIFVSGRLGAWALDVPASSRDFLGVVFAAGIVSIGLWQGLLLYLGVRFWVGLKK